MSTQRQEILNQINELANELRRIEDKLQQSPRNRDLLCKHQMVKEKMKNLKIDYNKLFDEENRISQSF